MTPVRLTVRAWALLAVLLVALLTVALFAGQHWQDERLDSAEPTVVAGRSWA